MKNTHADLECCASGGAGGYLPRVSHGPGRHRAGAGGSRAKGNSAVKHRRRPPAARVASRSAPPVLAGAPRQRGGSPAGPALPPRPARGPRPAQRAAPGRGPRSEPAGVATIGALAPRGLSMAASPASASVPSGSLRSTRRVARPGTSAAFT